MAVISLCDCVRRQVTAGGACWTAAALLPISCLRWFSRRAQVAQLVEHRTENAGVGGSNPPLGTTFAS